MPAEQDGASPEPATPQAVVEARLRQRDLSPRMRERLEMVKAHLLGQDLAAIMRWTGRSARTVRRWLARFASGGVEDLADAPRADARPRRMRGIWRRWTGPWTRRPPAWACPSTCGRRPA